MNYCGPFFGSSEGQERLCEGGGGEELRSESRQQLIPRKKNFKEIIINLLRNKYS